MSKLLTIPAGSPYITGLSNIGVITNYIVPNPNIPPTEQDRTFNASDVSMPNVASLLRDSSCDLESLCKSNKINPFALFRPNKQSPFRLDDFLGYNHDALPPTYFVGKQSSMTINLTSSRKIIFPFFLTRGERPPYMDDVATTWDRVKVIVKKTSGDININHYVVAKVINISVDATPQHIIEVYAPSNDYYKLTLSVEAFYCEGGYANIRPIEDTHPNIILQIIPYFINMYLRIAQMGSSGSVRHHYSDGQHTPTYEYASGVVYIDNSYMPVFSLVTPTIKNSIKTSVYYNGYYLPYSYTDCLTDGVWRIIGQLNNSGLAIGDKYKSLTGIWYNIAEIEPGYYAYKC